MTQARASTISFNRASKRSGRGAAKRGVTKLELGNETKSRVDEVSREASALGLFAFRSVRDQPMVGKRKRPRADAARLTSFSGFCEFGVSKIPSPSTIYDDDINI